MRKLRAFLLRLTGLFGTTQREREMADELESHLRLDIDDNLRRGMDAAEARRKAVLRLGGVEPVKEAWRDRRSLPVIETLLQDLRYAARTLGQNRGFTVVAVATLALGLGATTTVFSVAEAVLLRPLPYAEPERLVRLTETNPLKRWTSAPVAPANFADWRRMNTVFTDLGAYIENNVFLSGQGEPQRLKSAKVTGNLFDVISVSPLLGRTFTDEETFEGKDRVAILSHGLWQAQFSGDPQVIGRTISLTGTTFTVVGVMPPEFFFPTREVQLWLPLGFPPRLFTEHRRPHYLGILARLRPNVSLEQANEQMTAIAGRLEQMYPETNTQMGVRLDPFHATLARNLRPALLMLLGAVGVLFLVVCSNVANLQLGRATARAREFGIRQALGAGRARLIRQLLTESIVLSVLGGALGLALAAGARLALLKFAPAAIPPYAELRLDLSVMLFALGVTLFAPLLFGIVPALASARAELLRDRSDASPRTGRSLRDLFVGCQVALSLVLVVGAALLVQSLMRLESVAPGFTPQGAVSFQIALRGARYNEEQIVRAVQTIERKLREQPQVQAVGTSLVLPLRGQAWTLDATVEGRPAGEYERELRRNCATPGYFQAVGTPLLRGRFFTEFDTKQAPPVTIVNEALERAYFRGENAVGKRIKFGRPNDRNPWVTIVGVIADHKQDGLDRRPVPEAHSPLAQQTNDVVTLVVRGTASPETLVAAARQTVRSVDAQLALTDIAPLHDLVRASVGNQRFRTALLAAFAGIALFLAALGVYGVLAYAVARRTREIGIRMALGAPKARLFGLVVREGMRPVMAGAAVGLIAAYGAASLIETLLFGIVPADPMTYALTIAVLAAVAFGACALPAARALRVNPLVSLREQ